MTLIAKILASLLSGTAAIYGVHETFSSFSYYNGSFIIFSIGSTFLIVAWIAWFLSSSVTNALYITLATTLTFALVPWLLNTGQSVFEPLSR